MLMFTQAVPPSPSVRVWIALLLLPFNNYVFQLLQTETDKDVWSSYTASWQTAAYFNQNAWFGQPPLKVVAGSPFAAFADAVTACNLVATGLGNGNP